MELLEMQRPRAAHQPQAGWPVEGAVGLLRRAGNRAVSRLLAPEPTPTVQRYQAGDSGHEGIERDALGAGPVGAGFTSDEQSKIYFGNWLRDMSQLPKSALPILDTLSWGEFGHGVTAEQLGDYVPSEHMDNPEGGGTVEDPKGPGPSTELSADQKADQKADDHAGLVLAALVSGLPEYVERSKFHARQKLAEAVRLGRTDEGMLAMGEALHAIEDYFSHSNFAEACIYELRADPTIAPLVKRMHQTHLGGNMAMLVPLDSAGKPIIQTGTYGPKANSFVSAMETLETECTHGQLTHAFAVGLVRQAGMTGEDLGRRLGSEVGSSVGTGVGALVGGVTGAEHGLARGLASGWARGTGFFGTLGSMAEDVTGDVGHDAAAGAVSAWVALGAVAGQAAGEAGGYVGKSVGEVVALVGPGVVLALFRETVNRLFAGGRAGIFEVAAELGTAVSGGEARAQGLAGPTHSELAKDSPGNLLFPISRALAVEADRVIGSAMQAAWTAPGGPVDPVPLVDHFVAHPDTDPWWQPIIRAGGK